MRSNFEIFHVTYRMPKFGTENEYQDETHLFMVSTPNGKKDAINACERFHKGCKVESVYTYMEILAGVDKIQASKSKK